MSSNIPSQSMTSEHLRWLWGLYWDARTAKPRTLTAWEALGAWFRSRPTDASKPLDILPENAESLAIKARIEGITRAITARDTEHAAELKAADTGIERLKSVLKQERKYKLRWKRWAKRAWALAYDPEMKPHEFPPQAPSGFLKRHPWNDEYNQEEE